jgi:hypothetical protein
MRQLFRSLALVPVFVLALNVLPADTRYVDPCDYPEVYGSQCAPPKGPFGSPGWHILY